MSDRKYQGHSGHRGGSDGPSVADQAVREISTLKTLSALDVEKLVSLADQLGYFLAKDIRLKTSQIRKFLDAVNSIKSSGTHETEPDFRSECMLLKPKLAYAAGRQKEVKPLMEVLVPCIDRVHNKEDFNRFYRFVESIIAYHSYHERRD